MRKSFVFVVPLAMGLALGACSEQSRQNAENTAESVSNDLDSAVADATRAADESAAKLGEAADQSADAVGNAADKAVRPSAAGS